MLVITTTLAGCFVDSDEQIAKKNREQLITAIQNKDSESIKKMFAKNKIVEIKNFEAKIDELIAYYEGDYVSYKGGGPQVNRDKHDGRSTKEFRTVHDIITTVDTYCLGVVWYIEDTADAGNIGIWKIIFFKTSEDTGAPFWGGEAIIPEIMIGGIT